MEEDLEKFIELPPPAQIDRAVELYLDRAYGGRTPTAAERFRRPKGLDPAAWLMSGAAERDPPEAPLGDVRSFALRIGNARYPHMKLRLSRPPNETAFVFSVDCHDAFLRAPPGSADHEALEDLKRHNAAVAAAVLSAWDAAGLLTERNYLRRRIQQARDADPGAGLENRPPAKENG